MSDVDYQKWSRGDFDFIGWELNDSILTVTLDRAPVNAVNQHMYREIAYLFRSVDALAPEAKVAILRGNGTHFCAGNDLDEFATMTPTNSDERMSQVRSAFFAVQDCPIPVIGAVHGAVVGTGLALAASCDFVVAATGTRMGTPEVGVGVMGGARHLARLVPEPVMRWMYFTSELRTVEQLQVWGALIEISSLDDLMATAKRHAQLMTRHSSAVLRTAKKALNRTEFMDLQSGYTFEQSMTTEICGHPDSREAIRAAVEHRAPVYQDVKA